MPWKEQLLLPHRHRESSAEKRVCEDSGGCQSQADTYIIPIFSQRKFHRILSTFNVLTNVLVSFLWCLFSLTLNLNEKMFINKGT